MSDPKPATGEVCAYLSCLRLASPGGTLCEKCNNTAAADYGVDPNALRKERDDLRALLRVAKCPDTDCHDGVIPYGPDPDGNWEPQQCQWCDERKAALGEDSDGTD